MKIIRVLVPLLAALAASNAHATNGYFAHGYGIKSKGMGGVGIALPQDTLAGATNPAGMGLIGDRIDFGATLFQPRRESEISGSMAPVNGTYNANDSKNFIVPEFGYNRVISPDFTLGVSVYANGGMNTDYKQAIPLLGSSRAGVDLAQLFIAPTATWKITPEHTVGIALNLAYQRFEAKGLQNFEGFTAHPGRITNNGHDSSTGIGVHVGWIGQISDTVTLGATYRSKTHMSRFSKYKGLFAEGGDFDIPATYGLGIAVKATPALTLAADVQHIEYSKVDSVGRLSLSNLEAGNALGTANGPGFGWRDVDVIKLGASYQWNSQLTVRAGYNHSSQPIRSGETLFNVLAPGVVKDHVTFGATYVLPNKSELSFAYYHAFEEKVRGKDSIPGMFSGGEADIRMYQNGLGIAYGWNI